MNTSERALRDAAYRMDAVNKLLDVVADIDMSDEFTIDAPIARKVKALVRPELPASGRRKPSVGAKALGFGWLAGGGAGTVAALTTSADGVGTIAGAATAATATVLLLDRSTRQMVAGLRQLIDEELATTGTRVTVERLATVTPAQLQQIESGLRTRHAKAQKTLFEAYIGWADSHELSNGVETHNHRLTSAALVTAEALQRFPPPTPSELAKASVGTDLGRSL